MAPVKERFLHFQKNWFKNSPGVSIGIFSNGCNTSRSLSPVMIHDALQEAASSRYLLSFGSRQIVTVSVTVTKVPSLTSLSRNESRFSTGMYLSNLLPDSIAVYSSKIASEKASFPDKNIFRKESAGFEEENSAALIITLVSAIKYLSGIGAAIIFAKQVFHCIFIPFHQLSKPLHCQVIF